ncbi:helix-turn-helix domain-containing protein [Embleya sp. NPDC056575]|uniref:helix-turn-helix domain-containing protein n=1 Tax=unclassified Embleya TaxID=2699296 RepID=UPI0036796084
MTDPNDLDVPPAFSPSAAASARGVMALTCERVAATLASYELRVMPSTVAQWEAGTERPNEAELLALAKSLVVPVSRLMGGRPTNLQDHRIAAGLTRAELANRVRMREVGYTRLERANKWRADEERTGFLVRALGLSMQDLAEVSGVGPELENLLAEAVVGRWKTQLPDITRLIGMRRKRIGEVLEVLSSVFPEGMDVADVPRAAVVERFWGLLGDPVADPGAPGVWLLQGRFA